MIELKGQWSNVNGSKIVHFFVETGANSNCLCNYALLDRPGAEGRHCAKCERAIVAENKRREREKKSRAGLLEKIGNMDNATALARLIELTGDGASEWGHYKSSDAAEAEELEKEILSRLTYYVHGEL